MRKLAFRFSLLIVIVIAAAAVLPAAVIPCPESGALSVLTAMTLAGDTCQSQDKIFSNFVYTPVAGGVPATDVNFNLVLRTGIQDIHGWSFIPENAWVLGFTLSYDISVAPGFPLVAIIASKDQINTGSIPNGIVVTDTQTPGVMVSTGSFGGETQFISGYSLQTVHTSSVAVIPVGLNLLSYEQNWIESTGSQIPEPMSFVLIGTGLLGLGLVRRRARKC